MSRRYGTVEECRAVALGKELVPPPGTGGRSILRSCSMHDFQAEEPSVEELLGDPFEGHYDLLQVVDLILQRDKLTDISILEINPDWFRDLMKDQYKIRHAPTQAYLNNVAFLDSDLRLRIQTYAGTIQVVPTRTVSKEEIFRFRR